MRGVLVVDKPAGMTSARVVSRVKRALGGAKVGHTGTLDPMATGVLPMCVGEGTKIAGYLLADDKAYDGELILGLETDTLDTDGEITARDPVAAAAVGAAELEAAMAELTGDLAQVPPMYSALRVDGRRLHELARAGESVARAARPVTVHQFELLAYEPPRARFAVHCSKGTYVRSLVRDLGQRLACGACLSALRRTRSGRFDLADARALDDVGPDTPLIRPADALDHLPAVAVPADQVAKVERGLQLRWEQVSGDTPPDGVIRLLAPAGHLVALARIEAGKLAFERVFRPPQAREIK